MRRPPIRSLALAFVLGCAGGAESADSAVADSPRGRSQAASPTRLDPSAFSELADGIRAHLEQRGCVIPQSYPDSAPHNVVRGNFTVPDRMDVAVLCLKDTTSSIVLYRGEAVDSVEVLAERAHSREELASAGDLYSFSRALGTADSAFIQSRFERYGGSKPPVLDHLGLNDIFVGKASVVWYWHRGRWLQLQGSD